MKDHPHFDDPHGSTFQASFLVDQVFGTAFGAGFTFLGLGIVGDIFFQCPFNTVFPGINSITVEMQGSNQVNNIGNGHAMTEYTGEKLGIIPVFLVEHV